MELSSQLIHCLLLFPVVFVGVLLSLYGQTRRGILFGVIVSLDFVDSGRARGALRRYRLQVLAIVLADLLFSGLLLAWTPPRLFSVRVFVAIVAVPAELIATWFLWHYHSRLMEPKAAIVPLEIHTEPLPPSSTAPLIATLLSLVPISLTARYLHLHYDQLPSHWPSHCSLDGVAGGWGARTLLGVFGPLLAGAGIVLLVLFLSLALALAYRPASDAGSGSTDRRRMLAPLAALAWLAGVLSSFVSVIPLVSALPNRILLVHLIYLALGVGILVWLLRRGGLLFTPSASV